MTDPIKQNSNHDSDPEMLIGGEIEELEELPNLPEAEINAAPPAQAPPILEEQEPDLSDLFEEPAPVTPSSFEQEPTHGFFDEVGEIVTSGDTTLLDDNSSGSFKVLDESGLNDAAGNADLSDKADASSDQDISDMLEGLEGFEPQGTTSARAANLSSSSSGADSSGDLDIHTVSDSMDASDIDNVELDIIPTLPGTSPAAPSSKAGKNKTSAKPPTPTVSKSRGGMLVGSLLGLLGGIAASQALWVFGIELPTSIRQADSAQVKALKDLSEQASGKAKSLESDLETLKTVSEEASNKAKESLNTLTTEKLGLATKLTEQTTKFMQDLKLEQAKGEKAVTDAKIVSSKELDEQKAAAKADIMKYEKDLELAKSEAKVNLDKAVAESVKEKTRGEELATLLAANSKGLTSIAEKLKTAGFGESKIDPIAMAPIIDKALAMAQMKDPAGEIRKLTTKMNEEKTRLEGEVANRDALVKKQLEDLGRRRHPAANMAFWRAMLSAGIADSVHATEAAKDANHVLAEAPANSPEVAQAKIIIAMADTALGKLKEAKASIASVTANAATAGPGWADVVKNLNERLVSPAGIDLAKAHELAEFGKTDQAIAVLKKAIANPLPGDQALPRVRAELALFLISTEQKDFSQATTLADEAAKANEALGFYVLGRLKEAKGQGDEAGILYSQAINAAKETDPMLSQYRLARIRKLRGMAGNPAAVAMLAEDPETLATLLLISMTLVDAETLDVPDPKARAIKREMRAILENPKATLIEKAEALLEDGQPLQALEMLQTHMSKTLAIREPETLKIMVRIIKALDSKQVTGQSLTLSPAARKAEAYRQFGKGKQLVLAGKFDIAEETLTSAIKYAGSDVDARFHYFLGLAQLGQADEKTAERNFLRALELERRSQPSARDVSRSLEEVQGPARESIDALRYGAVLPMGR